MSDEQQASPSTVAPYFTPIVTEVGMQRLAEASQTEHAINISHIALGDNNWTPTAQATQLQHECQRVALTGERSISETQKHFSFVIQGETEYWVREVGLILDDGTLFAIWSDEEHPLAWKAAHTDLLLGYDLALTDLPTGRVENCRAHHYDHVSSPRSSNRTCATNASGFRSKCHAFALDTSAMVCAIL